MHIRVSAITAIKDWSQIQVHTDEWTQVHSARSSLVVTHQSTNQGLSFSERATELALVATRNHEPR